jgi:hypothetical protein
MTAERRRLIARALGREPETILEVDDGYDFEVAIVDDGWVFRFPRRSGVEEALELETLVLPALAPSLPVLVPSFEYVSHSPFFVGYRVIRGEPLVDEDGEGVRAFLDALHAFDTSELPVATEDWVEAYRNQCAEFERLVFPVLDSDRRTRARRLFADVETLSGFEPALLHADLGPEHLLVRDGRLVGVIDWGDMRVGDPALDYAWLLAGPLRGLGCRCRVATACTLLPPARALVRGALWTVHESASAYRARPSRDQGQTLRRRLPGPERSSAAVSASAGRTADGRSEACDRSSSGSDSASTRIRSRALRRFA